MQANNLADILLHVVCKYPHNVAIKDTRQSFTYQQLYNRAAGAAQILHQHGVKPCDRIVCISKKNTESIIVFWGIVLCEAIPVMLDYDDGIHSNITKTKEVKAKAVILDMVNSIATGDAGCELVLGFKDLEKPDHLNVPVPRASRAAITDVCYILLTSGTTGKSKAVQIAHGSVLHYAFSIYEKLGSPQKVNAVHASTFAADLGLTNLLVALVSGGMLRILDKTESTDPATFNNIIDEEEISLVKITPSHLLALISGMHRPYKRPINHIVLGGEKLSWETVQTILSLGICANLYNHYGPTEATIGAIAFKIEPHSVHFGKTGSVPLGTPLGQGNCFLENPADNIGELFIAGPGISIGYFENEVENKNKFFNKAINGRTMLCYRTGDICRKLDDGNYEFLYRTDRQVKVKGYRIEPGEIEMAISTHPDIENAIVCLSDNREHNVLEAYIKIPKGREINKDIKTWLLNRLPAYKIPADFYFYTEAPYNSNGKIDLPTLKKKFKRHNHGRTVEPDILVSASWPVVANASWKMILGKSDVAPSDDFFTSGGDSLLAIQLIGRLQRYGFNIHITNLNNCPVFSDFIALNPERLQERPAFDHKRNNGRLTFSQQQFLLLNGPNAGKYCQSILLETEDKIKIREMAQAVHFIIESHAELTRCFEKQPFPRHYPSERNIGVTVIDSRQPVVTQIQGTCNMLLNRISLEKGPLFIAHLFIDHSGKDYIYFICHHLCIDVISWNIIIDEFCDYYDRLLKNDWPVVTPEDTVHHFFQELAHYTFHQEPVIAQADLKIYKLPKTGPATTAIQSIAVNQVTIPDEVSDILCKLAESSAAVGGFLLSALGNALLQEFDIPIVTIDMEFHGRPNGDKLPDLSRSVAWWATTWPLNLKREQCNPRQCIELIQAISPVANNINLLHDQFNSIANAQADIRFNYLGHFPEMIGNDSVKLKPASFNSGPTRSEKAQEEYKLYCTARFIGKALLIDFQYQLNVLAQQTVQHIIDLFMNALLGNVKNGNGNLGHFRLPVFESNMPSVGQPMYHVKACVGNSFEKSVVFLTGATGFLGIHLLDALSKNQALDIYCLTRGKSELHAGHRLESAFRHFFDEMPEERKNRIHVVKGDLVSDQFGMSDDYYKKMVAEADIILHAAADTNLLKSYRELTRTNLLPMQQLIRLADTGKSKAIHYVSTLAVSGFSPNGSYRSFSEDDFDYGQIFISDYERTKFESEKVIRAFFANGGRGNIYRVGHIAADSRYGRFQRNIDQNRVFQIIKGMMLLKRIPEAYTETLSFSHVDIVANAIIHFSLLPRATHWECLHIDNPHYLSFIQVAELLRQTGYDIDITHMDNFKEAVDLWGGNKDSIELMNSWVRRALSFPRRVNYIHRKTIDRLAEAGLYFPSTEVQWFSCMLQQGIKAGYFPAAPHARSASSLV